MRAIAAGVFGFVLGAGVFAGGALSGRGYAQEPIVEKCSSIAEAKLRTTLYFGLARPKGAVTELEWQMFLRDEVTARFPDGLTVWEAEGQWRQSDGSIGHEQSKVLLLVHPDTSAARRALQTLIERYQRMFDQQSVLWETARVCAAS